MRDCRVFELLLMLSYNQNETIFSNKHLKDLTWVYRKGGIFAFISESTKETAGAILTPPTYYLCVSTVHVTMDW